MDTTAGPLRIVGAPGSPYSRKLRAVLRYRRIPHAWINQGTPEARGLPEPRVQLLPQLILPGPGGGFVAPTDSTTAPPSTRCSRAPAAKRSFAEEQ